MPPIDTRTNVSFRQILEVLLEIAESPLAFVDRVKLNRIHVEEYDCIVASQLARQASATVVSNCVVELWSETVACLHSLEPDFPFFPASVSKFVAETRLPFMSYVSLYYSLCGKPFEGTVTAEQVKTLVDMRHELQHDKPENREEYSTVRVNRVLKWRRRLEPLVGAQAIVWQPRVKSSAPDVPIQIQGEPTIMKFMKFPVAKWAAEATCQITEQMRSMLFSYKGKKKLWTEKPLPEGIDMRFSSDGELLRLWSAGE